MKCSVCVYQFLQILIWLFFARLRSRPETLSNEEQEKNKQLLKLWCNYKYKQSMLEAQMIDRICSSQQRALDQLKLISPELYNESIQVWPKIIGVLNLS